MQKDTRSEIYHELYELTGADVYQLNFLETLVTKIRELQQQAKRVENTEEVNKALKVKGWHVAPCCSGCGSFATGAELAGFVSCCPERKMIEVMVPPGFIDRDRLERENKRAGLERTGIYTPKDMDPALKDLVSSFAGVLAERLHLSAAKGKSGWQSRYWQAELCEKLHRAPDPVDVAAYAAFAWSHGWIIDPPQEKAEPEDEPRDPEWLEMARIADVETVDGALRELVEDSTADNGVRVVQAIYHALEASGKIKPRPCEHTAWENVGGGRRCCDCNQFLEGGE